MTNIAIQSQKVVAAAKLRPKEHGAYAIIAIPMLSALIVGGANLVALGIVVASICGFIANEPLMVACGNRGARAQRSTPAARNRLVALLAVAFVAGVCSFFLASSSTRWALVTCLVFALTSFVAAARGAQRSLVTQLLGCVSLSMPSVTILLAGDISFEHSFVIWATWLLGFTATTVAVRSVIASQKGEIPAVYDILLVSTSVIVVTAILSGYSAPVLAMPMIIASYILRLDRPAPKHLKRVGWTLVAVTSFTLIGVIVWFA